MRTTDIAVIGGGIIGTSATYYLARKKIKVALLERSCIGRESSGSTAGTMSFQNKKIELVPLVREALQLWSGLQEDLGDAIEFRRPGGFRVAENEEQVERLRQSVAEQQELGIEVEVKTGADLKSAAPYFGPAVAAASFCPEDGRSNPLTATLAIARGASRMGAEILERRPVEGIDVLGPNRFRIRTGTDSHECSHILNCAGYWTRDILRMVGHDYPITLDPMQVMVTERTSRIFPHIITHVSGKMTLKHVDSGNVVIGGGWSGIGDADRGIKLVDYSSMKGNLGYATRVIPALSRLQLIRCWTGLEGRSPDKLPLIGELKSVPGFHTAACAKGGWTLGPLMGRTAAEILAGESPGIDVGAFDVNRFAKA